MNMYINSYYYVDDQHYHFFCCNNSQGLRTQFPTLWINRRLFTNINNYGNRDDHVYNKTSWIQSILFYFLMFSFKYILVYGTQICVLK